MERNFKNDESRRLECRWYVRISYHISQHLIQILNLSYIQWSLHNPKDNVYNFDGIANITDVIEAAKEAGLYVILRPGPYICAEIDNGGIPYWLFNKYPGINMRVSDISKIITLIIKDSWQTIAFIRLHERSR